MTATARDAAARQQGFEDADDWRSLPERIEQSQLDVDDVEKALRLRREQRRRLVVHAIDSGSMTQRQVARALRRGTGLVHKILTQPEWVPDEEE